MNKNNKINKLITYILSVILILSLTSLIAGCAPEAVIKNGSYSYNRYQTKPTSNDKFKKTLENKVIAASLRLNGLSNNKIKKLLTKKPLKKPSASTLKMPLYRPSFMVKTYNIPATNTFKTSKNDSNADISYNNDNNTNKIAENSKININKSVEVPNCKLIFYIKSVKFKNIFEIINFSLKNLSRSPVKYKLLLLNGKKPVFFKSDLENKGFARFHTLTGFTEIKGDIIFLKRKNNEKFYNNKHLTIEILSLIKNENNGRIKFIKLIYKLRKNI